MIEIPKTDILEIGGRSCTQKPGTAKIRNG